jgi:hypothetical protein
VYDDDSKLPQIIKEVDAMTPSQYTSLSERATMTGRKYYWPIIYDQAFEMKG